MAGRTFAAFLSYAHRYREWVEVLHRNLERCLGEGRVFFDRQDLRSGLSWVGGLEDGLAQAEQLVLVLTPEALASAWVTKERRSFLASRGPRQPMHVVHLVETPPTPFLADLQWVDFREHDEEKYRGSLRELVAGLRGAGPREAGGLPPDLEVPPAPKTLPGELRSKLTAWLEPVLSTKGFRLIVAAGLGLDRNALEGHPSPACVAAAALALATGDDDPLPAAIRIADGLADVLGEDLPEERVEELRRLREEIETSRERQQETGLLGAWLSKVVQDHERLVPYFQQRTELAVLDRVYVQLELRAERRGPLFGEDRKLRLDRPWRARPWASASCCPPPRDRRSSIIESVGESGTAGGSRRILPRPPAIQLFAARTIREEENPERA